MNSNLAGGIESTENSSRGVKISSRVRVERLRFHMTVYLDAKLLNVPPTFLSLEWYSPSSITFICQKHNLGFHDFFFSFALMRNYISIFFIFLHISPSLLIAVHMARVNFLSPIIFSVWDLSTFNFYHNLLCLSHHLLTKLLRFIHSGHFIDMILIFMLVL